MFTAANTDSVQFIRQSPVMDTGERGRLYLKFIETELDFYFALAILAATQHRIGQVKAAKQSEAIAEIGYSTLQRYLSDPARAGYLTGRRRGDLDMKMIMFREALDGL